jgi:iron(III) transport system ATP-binding protein
VISVAKPWQDSAAAAAAAAAAAGSQPVLKVRGLRKRFRRAGGSEINVIDGMDLDLHMGECLILLGPSGCGKTTLLRCIAGLEVPDAGTIEVQGELVFSAAQAVSVPAERRNLSMVFQSYALWPHMTVAENIAYPLRSMPRRDRPSGKDIMARVDAIMEKVGIVGLQQQHPGQISGGQQQRVALCRALIAGSGLVLFDEPLSNVDAQIREQLRLELREMQREFGFAAAFVTHDRQEAMALGDTIAVLDSGSISQLGSPRAIYTSPVNLYVARFIGPVNEWPVTAVTADGDGQFAGQARHGSVHGRLPGSAAAGAVGSAAAGPAGAGVAAAGVAPNGATAKSWVAAFRPERCLLSSEQPAEPNSWPGVIEQASFSGTHTEYLVRLGDDVIRVVVPGEDDVAVDAAIWVRVPPADMWLITAAEEAGAGPSEGEAGPGTSGVE